MAKYFFYFLLLAILPQKKSIAQTDKFTGTWTFQQPGENNTNFNIELRIASPEADCLYPALLTIRYAQFTGVYQLLLVKKNERQLAIGRHKYPVKEEPFGIGAYTIPFNGSFDFSDNKLSVNRLVAQRYGFAVPALSVYNDENKMTVLRLSEFLKSAPVTLQKINNAPWRSADAAKMLHTHSAPDYFGLVDSFYVKTTTGTLRFFENTKKTDDDTVSVMLNNRIIVNRIDIDKNTPAQPITLDTGLNILVLFADNYGKIPPNTAGLQLSFGDKKFSLDFTTLQNTSATFIVAKIYVLPENQQAPAEMVARKTIEQKIQQRQTKLIDSIQVTSQEVMLAIWDDAVEDGDSISLQLNNEIYMPGLAVKKKPQFIPVKLYAGENNIVFIADNLGSIPPNTAILEINDGKRRKSYMIDTDMRQNNAIKITYQLVVDN